MTSGVAWLGETPAAWMTPLRSPSAVAVWTSACTDSREDTSTGRSAQVKTGIGQYLGRLLGILLMQIGEQDMLACADPAGDGLANLASSDDDYDVAHERLLLTQRL